MALAGRPVRHLQQQPRPEPAVRGHQAQARRGGALDRRRAGGKPAGGGRSRAGSRPGAGNAPQTATAEEAAKLGAAYAQAVEAIKAQQWDTAEAALKEVLAKVPNQTVVHFNLGHVYRQKRDFASAEAEFKKVIELEPAKPDAYVALAALYEAEAKGPGGRRAAAEERRGVRREREVPGRARCDGHEPGHGEGGRGGVLEGRGARPLERRDPVLPGQPCAQPQRGAGRRSATSRSTSARRRRARPTCRSPRTCSRPCRRSRPRPRSSPAGWPRVSPRQAQHPRVGVVGLPRVPEAGRARDRRERAPGQRAREGPAGQRVPGRSRLGVDQRVGRWRQTSACGRRPGGSTPRPS